MSRTNTKVLVALPAYNERAYLPTVLDAIRVYPHDILVVDDGSTDDTADILRARPAVRVLSHATNEGYGAALRDAFGYGLQNGYDVVITMDVDGQHEPQRIPELLEALTDNVDIASASRYLKTFTNDVEAPPDRRAINEEFTRLIRERLGLQITDAFCGFKAYRRRALERIEVTEPTYEMPLEVWVQVARYGLRVVEIPIPRIYLPGPRAFGGAAAIGFQERHRRYHLIFDRALKRWPVPTPHTP